MQLLVYLVFVFDVSISNSRGTNGLKLNVVTTLLSAPHSNRVRCSDVLPSC